MFVRGGVRGDASSFLADEPGDVVANGFGIGFAFLFEDAGGEGVGGVGGEDGDFLLQDGRAGVVGVVGVVDGAAGLFFAGGEDGGVDVVAVHAFAAEFGEEGGVDVHNAAGEIVGDGPEGEEAGHEGEFDAVMAEDVGDAFGEGVEGTAVFAGDDVDGDVKVLCALDAVTSGIAGDDAGDLGVEFFAGDGVGKVLECGAAAGDEDAQAKRIHLSLPTLAERTLATESQRHRGRTEATGENLRVEVSSFWVRIGASLH